MMIYLVQHGGNYHSNNICDIDKYFDYDTDDYDIDDDDIDDDDIDDDDIDDDDIDIDGIDDDDMNDFIFNSSYDYYDIYDPYNENLLYEYNKMKIKNLNNRIGK
eukprot:jgi/Orpsp1_1/1191075/evm.model.d7180000083301.1